jgi:hypothetical protein
MARLPEEFLGAFDFIWSSGAAGRLGGVAEGIEFVAKSCGHLAPGGAAAHTVEYNAGSNEATAERGPVALFRRRDIEEMERRVRGFGCRMAAPSFDCGAGELESCVDDAPYGTPHLKMRFGPFVTTSYLIVIEKGRGG